MVDWLYDELVLAGDALRANNWHGIRATSAEAKSLAALLSKGQLHPGEDLPDNFRTPSSIQRKSYDLATASSEYIGVSTHGGKLAGIVIAEFRTDPEGMKAKAEAIRSFLAAGLSTAADSGPQENQDEEIAAHEGGIIEKLAMLRERDRGLRKKKLASVLKSGGVISCEACGFDFRDTYGERGEGYIEVHHVNPLHVTGPTKTNLDDLALMCSNCHRMCHRGKWITPADIAALIAAQDGRPRSRPTIRAGRA